MELSSRCFSLVDGTLLTNFDILFCSRKCVTTLDQRWVAPPAAGRDFQHADSSMLACGSLSGMYCLRKRLHKGDSLDLTFGSFHFCSVYSKY